MKNASCVELTLLFFPTLHLSIVERNKNRSIPDSDGVIHAIENIVRMDDSSTGCSGYNGNNSTECLVALQRNES